jgi:hypothetical protein
MTGRGLKERASIGGEEKPRGLSVLLSQVLVAYTVEFDNEFERRMGAAGYRGAGLSLGVWSNVMRRESTAIGGG